MSSSSSTGVTGQEERLLETRQWPVEFEIALPAAGSCTILPSTYQLIAQALDGVAPILNISPGCLGVSFRVRAADFLTANSEASEALARVLHLLRLSMDAVTAARVGDVAKPAREEDADFVGVGEAADILGVSKQRIHQLTKRNDFPTPRFRLRATPVWSKSDIEDYNSRRQRHG